MTDVQSGPEVGEGPPAVRPARSELEPASDEVVELAPGVLRMQLPVWLPGLGHVNMYGLVDDRGLTLVDPGLPGPGSWRALRRRLQSAGYRLRDVHTVVVTHSHPDHFGGAGRLQEETGAQLITHKSFQTDEFPGRRRRVSGAEVAAAEEIAAALGAGAPLAPAAIPTVDDHVDDYRGDPLRAHGGTRERGVPWRKDPPWGGKVSWRGWYYRRFLQAMAILFDRPEPTRRVVHGDRLRLGGREWLALHTPGHTVDHLCLYDPEHGVLLTGDHVLPSITPHVAGVAGADSLHSYLQTLDLVAALDGLRLGLPAHGSPFDDVPARVAAIKRHHEDRIAKLRTTALALGPSTVEALERELFPRRHWGPMAASETYAHLEHMVAVGEAERFVDGHDLRYRMAPV